MTMPNHEAKARRSVAAKRAKALADELDSLTLLALYDALGGRVRAARFPALHVSTFLDDDGETTGVLRCPHCDAVVSGIDSDGIRVVDDSVRWKTSDDVSMDDRTVSFAYDDAGDYDTLHYACGSCGEAVDLPEGWSER